MKNKIKTKGEVNKTLILLVGLFFIFTFFSFNLISAFKPVTTEFTGEQNYVIEANVFDVYKTNEGACVHIYVFNKSGGNIADSTEVSCRIELSNHNGTNLMVGSPTTHEDHFEMCRPASLITEPDTFGLSIVCNDSYMYGIKTAFFEVTESGEGGIPIEWVLVIAMLFAVGLMLLGFKTDNSAPFVMASFLLLALSLMIWKEGFGALGAKNLISQFIAGGCFLVGGYIGIQTALDEFK